MTTNDDIARRIARDIFGWTEEDPSGEGLAIHLHSPGPPGPGIHPGCDGTDRPTSAATEPEAVALFALALLDSGVLKPKVPA